jgi:hypothetical protein
MSPWIKLSNGSRVRADKVASLSSHASSLRIFLKDGDGELLCFVEHDDEELFKAEMEEINRQLDA